MRCILWTLTWQQKLLLLLRLWSVLWEHYHDIIMSRASFKNVRLEFLLGVYFKFPKIISYRFTPFGDIKPNLIIRNNKNTVHWIDWIMNLCIHCIKFSDSEFFFREQRSLMYNLHTVTGKGHRNSGCRHFGSIQIESMNCAQSWTNTHITSDKSFYLIIHKKRDERLTAISIQRLNAEYILLLHKENKASKQSITVFDWFLVVML